ncbi:MAG: hypothetical protein JRF20_06495, partial [Deltaproteobacteria bacterium]|nr:hypothetical protein [Deltaproteobacteria bacterium]
MLPKLIQHLKRGQEKVKHEHANWPNKALHIDRKGRGLIACCPFCVFRWLLQPMSLPAASELDRSANKKLKMAYMSIKEGIQAYHSSILGEHHRYRSWEHCYSYFQAASISENANHDYAALQLGFYLASWGMYRGSSFLLQHSYTVHLGVIDLLFESRFSQLWKREFGANDDSDLISVILDAVEAIKKAYRDSASLNNSGQPTDTLITKVLLGTFGCLPACDRYFIDGFKSTGFSYSYLNRKFIERILTFSQDNLRELREQQ